MKIQIKKFKKIDEATITLSPINIFIGANNSGKSSFIQGIQFAVSSCQTLKLKGSSWSRAELRTLSLDSSEYLYTPTKNIESLYHGRKLTGAKTRDAQKSIEFTFSDEHNASLSISKGKNGGFTTKLQGKELGELLCDINSPYCVYIPGLAGIPIHEKYEVPIAVKKSATRGDSNNYLRNVLLHIYRQKDRWEQFSSSVNNIYSNTEITVLFDENTSEFIEVKVLKEGIELPLDSVGNGLLQVIQIFAYIEYFSPEIILLDEPDAHIHPTKQKLLAEELVKKSAINTDLKVIFSTHSRYILDVLEDKAQVVHFQDGKVRPNIKSSKILVDIGAIDADYLFSKRNLKYIVVTEDRVDGVLEKKDYLKKFLLSNGLQEDDFVLHSYESCTKVDFAKILQGFVQKQIPTAKIILHLDRDQKLDSDHEIIKLRADCKAKGIILFVTEYQEIESYFCRPEHLCNIYGVSFDTATTVYNKFTDELKDETKRKLINFILRERPEKGLNKSNQTDIAVVSELVNEWYELYKQKLTPGKELLGKIKSYIQNELHGKPNDLISISEGLSSEYFRSLIQELEPVSTSTQNAIVEDSA
jgi:AAA15 family ATPase/GTPase